MEVPSRLESTTGTGSKPDPQIQASVIRGGPHGSELEAILGEVAVPPSSSGERGLITVDELERRYIERVLAITSGNKSRAAQILGFDRRTLYRKIERYGRTQ
jgi:DNA-binding NtrC family response regulator